MTSALFSKEGLIRFVETFIAVLVAEFAAALASGGVVIDLTTPEGIAAILAALGAAALLALRRALAVAGGTP